MPSSYASVVVDADPEDVWRYIRNFDGAPGYLDFVETSEISAGRPADQVGCERVLLLQGDTVVRDVLIGLDDERREPRYHLPESLIPFSNYYSTMRVHPVSESGATFLARSGRYDSEEADAKANDEQVAGQFYASGLGRLRDPFERRAG